jgi:phage pi2 protein 07
MDAKHIRVKDWIGYIFKHPNFTGSLIDKDGDVVYYQNGEVHRDNDLPAIVHADGTKQWQKNGKLHRENGPALIFPDGEGNWYLNQKLYTEQEHRIAVRHIKLKLLDIG